MSLPHEDLTRAVCATSSFGEPPEYPGFSEDPLEGFRHLAHDLVRFAQVFVVGSVAEFTALVRWVERNPKPSGFSALK
jgi:hypothetical protein